MLNKKVYLLGLTAVKIPIPSFNSVRQVEARTAKNHPAITFPLSFGAGVEPSPLLLLPFTGLLYQPWMIDSDDCGAISGMNEQ
jgi:hypothetical protein